MKSEKAHLHISRFRIGTDGDGIRTLVSFSGCPLDCKYCLNPTLRSDDGTGTLYTPKELFDEIKRDRYYFLTTHGGVTFSGGEPLLHPDFIKEFCELSREEGWNVNIESCLNVNTADLAAVAEDINLFIVDIKDLNPYIYSMYTGGSVNPVIANLNYLREACFFGHVLVRVPLIPEFNTKEDVKKTISILKKEYQGFSFLKFTYVLPGRKRPQLNGKKICRILKAVRSGLIEENSLDIVQPICTNRGNCPGTCPVCEAELDKINSLLGTQGQYDETELGLSEFDKDLYGHTGAVDINMPQLLGIATPPELETLLGDMKPCRDEEEGDQ